MTGERCDDISAEMLCVKEKHGMFSNFYHGKEWHIVKRAATDDVLDRFTKQARSLRKRLAQLDQKRDKALKAIEGMELP